ncbi:uncharacterized protein LOC115673967 [Syzygium oleosum]|uniref:uncharacterized protein LOC115673967 n=1 Tax=Syzygium oleosum TaxID=219896 RepID=UPI0011D24562|nr:uncharacterized protein LOC115673967 [Syzygium oleosum]
MSNPDPRVHRARAGRGQAGARGRAKKDRRLDRLLQALETMRNLMGQQAQNQAAATAAHNDALLVGDGNEDRPMHRLVEQFLKLKPSMFTGTGDPEAVTLWIKELETIFALLRCSKEDKVMLAVYQLQGNASNWWEATQGRIFPEGTVPTWDAFVEAFNGKYFSKCTREQKMEKFLRLRQNHLTVDQYEAKFAELSKYEPRMIEDLVDKARRFRDGLKPELQSQLVSLNLKDYNELYERA